MSPAPLDGQQQQPQPQQAPQHQHLQQLLLQTQNPLHTQQQHQDDNDELQEPLDQLEGHEQIPLLQTSSDIQRNGTISLGVLIDFSVQRTYHDLTVLAEILPRKNDVERKIEIHNFAVRTRQLFVRLLALVKWANSASKVDKSAHIMSFLDKQSMLFVETADMLAKMSRETLVNACLPDFQIPAAAEILTTGTYSRLPLCIRDRIVPEEPITLDEKENTLLRLNQVIQHRLVTDNLLPQMRNVKIEDGRVTFHVKHEFEVSLTVMGDGPSIPWRLLDVQILVEDKETGGGQELVHPLQVEYVQEVIQARLADNPNPLNEVYNILHFFAQSLQLEVLYSQAIRLQKDRLGDHLQIHSYQPGHHLTALYWNELSKKDPQFELGYRLTVEVNERDSAKPLDVIHNPYLIGHADAEIAEKAIHSGSISMERLLVHTIHIRTKARLTDLKTEIQSLLPGVECSLSGVPAILSVPLLHPCQRAEQMIITINTYSGIIQCSVPQYQTPLTEGIETALNGDWSKLPTLLSELRFWLMKRRCEKTLMHLPVTVKDYLPLLSLQESPLAARLGRHHMLVQLNHHPTSILIVDLHEKKGSALGLACTFYLASVKPASAQDEEENAPENEMPKPYFKVLTLIELDTFVATHGPCTSVDDSQTSGKRKAPQIAGQKMSSRPKHSAYFIPELAHVVSLCEGRIPFISLCQELTKRGIPHHGIQVEPEANGLVLQLLILPAPDHVSSSDPYYVALTRRLLSVSIRSATRILSRIWILELVFAGSPLRSFHPKEQGNRRPVYLHYDMLSEDQAAKTIDAILADWMYITQIYMLAEELAEGFKSGMYHLEGMCVVKSYNYLHFILGYGPGHEAIVTIGWDIGKKAYCLLFGTSGKAVAAHGLVRSNLEVFLNQNTSSVLLVQVLHETYDALAAISKLPTTPHFGIISTRPTIPIQTWNLVSQTPTVLRLVYEGTFCIEIKIKGSGCVSLRDGVFSSFGCSSLPDLDLIAIQDLKVFLSKYVLENFPRRSNSPSDNEDEPPSPALDSDASNIGAGRGANSPANAKDGLRFHTPLTPPLGSNPHTPASPHMSGLQNNQHQPNIGLSPGSSFNMASPPSISTMGPSTSPGAANSPNPLPMPSPLQMPSASPQPSMIGHSPAGSIMTTHMDGSPFAASQGMASPGASNWPGSPMIPRPSPARPGQSPDMWQQQQHQQQQQQQQQQPQQQQPQQQQQQARTMSRSWAALPMLLSYPSLEVLCKPCPTPASGPNMLPPQMPQGTPQLCPLERFLGCVFMRRQMHRFIQSEEMLTDLRTDEPSFKTECLQCRLVQNPFHHQTLHLKVTPILDYKDQLLMDEIQIIEKFFEMRVACPPYKPNSLLGMARILCTPIFVLKDFIQIMKFDLMPNLAQQANFKWSVQLCLRVPPSTVALIVPVGQAGVLLFRNKILCFIQLTRICAGPGEGASIVLPLVYDIALRSTQVAEKREQGPALAAAAANIQLKRFADYSASSHSGQESMLLLAVRDLLMNLNLPSDISQVAGLASSAGCHSPAGMMHSHPHSPHMGPGMNHGMNMGMNMAMGHMSHMGPTHMMGHGMNHGMGHGMGMGHSMGHSIGHGMGHSVPMGHNMAMGHSMGHSGSGAMMSNQMAGMCGPMVGSGLMSGPMPGPMSSPMGLSGPHMGQGQMGQMGPLGHVGTYPSMGP